MDQPSFERSPSMSPAIIPLAQVAALLPLAPGVARPSYQQIWTLIAAGQVPAVRVRSRVHVAVTDLPGIVAALGLAAATHAQASV
jgi:hypothetical protein